MTHIKTKPSDEAAISIKHMTELTRMQLPFARDFGFVVDEMRRGFAIARAPYHDKFLRPGGTVAGPILMALADYAMYAAVLSELGQAELALTTHLGINFLRRPPPGDVLARASLIKCGRHLVVGEVEMFTRGSEKIIAHVTSTYSLPPHVRSEHV